MYLFIYLLYIKLAKVASEASLNQRVIPAQQAKMRGIALKTEVQKTKV